MRLPQRRVTRRQNAQTLSVSAPVSGWNARDSLADMKPTDAVILDNMFCTPYDVVLRKGYSSWATGITGTVNTIFSYSPTSGSLKMFAAAGSNIYDTTNAGAVGAAVLTGLGSDKWQYVNFVTAGGSFLILANGVDTVRQYNGSAWSVAAITGVTTSNLISVSVFKSRLWFIEQATLKAWYLGTSSISGAVTAFDFASVFNRGGYLVEMGDWSLDAGYGMDDYAVFMTSEGQIAIYKGTDPASAATWALIGVYDMGQPIGRRCMTKYAGDLLVIGKDGLLPLSKALMSSRVNTKEALSDKIQHVVSEYTTNYGSNFGWETTVFPEQNMVIVNVPIGSGNAYQLVMNSISGAWSRFIGWNTNVIELHGNDIFFGGNGAVYKGWNTNADNGTNINFEALQSFNYFGNRTQLKKVEMLRPTIMTDGWPAILLGVNVDFDRTPPTGTPTFSAGAIMPGVWDTAVWDGLAPWGGELSTKRDWQTGFGLGYCFAAHMKGASRNYELHWISTDYVINAGGII